VKAWTGGVGADLVVELGGAATLEQSLRCVRPGGTIALIGVLGGGQAQVTLARIFMHGVRVQGILVGSRADLEGLVRALEAHPQVRPVVGGAWGFEELPAAFSRLATGGHVGKLVVRIGS
jgi:NADPH:quinone reductase-like Zn-dependent oxidoreductase